MRIFKFGGASVKDAEGVRNLAQILSSFKDEKLVVVISAMGKTTNSLEKVVNAYYERDEKVHDCLGEVKTFHSKIIADLKFKKPEEVLQEIDAVFVEMEWTLEEETARSKGYSFAYDQIVSQGEMLSTKIISRWLNENNISNSWLDVRDCIITDNTYRDAGINWAETEKLTLTKIHLTLNNNSVIITQGFIGATSENFTTTLGREGSDYTAAILAHVLSAKEVVVWKDVPGILSADPKYYEDAVKLQEVSYHDAVELTYYGASVIHPKTIKPLENKNIPLRVCSFKSPQEKGTLIGNFKETKPQVPCFIFKTNQILISISAEDFSFIAEENLSDIFSVFSRHAAKINLMQNSAISFSVCMDNDRFKIPALLNDLKKKFRVLYNDGLRLVTVRHYYPATIEKLTEGKTILLEQQSRHTAQFVIQD
ncbi:MAG TPA: aspartate kinase [Bacteroidia bacterium]|nr:aspartate kinase [Bacteroidia bacterium]